MRILVVSDTHGHLENFERLIYKLGQPDMVIHLGDVYGQETRVMGMCNCPVKFVKGNGDFGSDAPAFDVIEVRGNRIFATHGHRYGVNFGIDRLVYAAEENECNIALYGHTHIPDHDYAGRVEVINPGSLSEPRGPVRKPTYAIIDINENGVFKASICNLDDLFKIRK